jgi:hypothetical protein
MSRSGPTPEQRDRAIVDRDYDFLVLALNSLQDLRATLESAVAWRKERGVAWPGGSHLHRGVDSPAYRDRGRGERGERHAACRDVSCWADSAMRCSGGLRRSAVALTGAPLRCYNSPVVEDGKMTPETTVRLPVALLEQVRVIANRHQRSLRSEVRFALMEYVRRIEAATE